MIGKFYHRLAKGRYTLFFNCHKIQGSGFSCYHLKCVKIGRNKKNFYINLGGYDVNTNGGVAEYSKIFAKNLNKIDNISLKEVVFLEPFSGVIYGLDSIKVIYGDKALIFRAGPIVLIILQLFKISGASRITMFRC